MKTILLIEGDPQLAEGASRLIHQRHPATKVVVLSSEHEFLSCLPIMGAHCPSLVICDLRLPWALPDPNAPKPPAEVKEQGPRRAGVRCWRAFRSFPGFKEIPWVYYTLFAPGEIPFEGNSDLNTSYLSQDCSAQEFNAALHQVLTPA